jgi:hypothetical protein
LPSTKARLKIWDDVTDDDIVDAVRFACEERFGKGADGDFATAQSVEEALTQPNAEQWPDGGPNALLGLGLIPKFGHGSPPRGAITRRLKRLVSEKRLRAVRLVTPRGHKAADGYVAIEKGSG